MQNEQCSLGPDVDAQIEDLNDCQNGLSRLNEDGIITLEYTKHSNSIRHATIRREVQPGLDQASLVPPIGHPAPVAASDFGDVDVLCPTRRYN
jgi:hypothetical protein